MISLRRKEREVGSRRLPVLLYKEPWSRDPKLAIAGHSWQLLALCIRCGISSHKHAEVMVLYEEATGLPVVSEGPRYN